MSQPPEDDPPAGVTESSYFGISRINHEDGSKCLVYSDGEGVAERWLTAKGWARVSQEKREELAAEYPKFCVLFEARAAGLKREAVRAAEAVSKAKAEKKKTFGQCPMGRKIKEGRPGQRWPWPKRIYDEASEHRCGIADLLNSSWLKLLATDKDTLVSQTREYGFAKGALWGTQEKIDGEFSQVGRSADAWPVVEDEHGNVTFRYTQSTIVNRTVPKAWKGDASGSAATYWDTEVRRIKPEFVIKLTNAEQLKYAKLLAGVAEISAPHAPQPRSPASPAPPPARVCAPQPRSPATPAPPPPALRRTNLPVRQVRRRATIAREGQSRRSTAAAGGRGCRSSIPTAS